MYVIFNSIINFSTGFRYRTTDAFRPNSVVHLHRVEQIYSILIASQVHFRVIFYHSISHLVINVYTFLSFN